MFFIWQLRNKLFIIRIIITIIIIIIYLFFHPFLSSTVKNRATVLFLSVKVRSCLSVFLIVFLQTEGNGRQRAEPDLRTHWLK